MTICTKAYAGEVTKNSKAQRGKDAKASASGFARDLSSTTVTWQLGVTTSAIARIIDQSKELV